MRRFNQKPLLFLLVFFCLAACGRNGDILPDLEDTPPPVSGEESVPPSGPEPSGGDPELEVIPPAPPPEYPSADLAAEWPENNIAVEQTVYRKTFTKGGAATLTAGGTFPKTGVAAVDGYYQNCRDDFERLCEKRAEDAASDARAYEYTANFTVECNAGGLFSVSRTVYEYTGGAHGETGVYCETFSAATGQLYTLDDFFAAGREQYTARMLEYVYAAIDENPDEYWPDAKIIARDVFPFQTFCVTMDGISLFFPEYNIAPFTAGTIRIEIPWGALVDMFILPGQTSAAPN